VTEPRMRDLFTWVEAQRESLPEQAGALAECLEWLRGGSVLDRERACGVIERVAFEHGAALVALERAHPRDPALDEQTNPAIDLDSIAPPDTGAPGWLEGNEA
jgi:hypothetical protein